MEGNCKLSKKRGLYKCFIYGSLMFMGRVKAGKPKKAEKMSAGHQGADFLHGLPAGVDPRVINLTPEQTETFIRYAKATMDAENAMIAIGMAITLQIMAAELKAKRVSIARLCAILFGAKTEKTDKVCPSKDGKASKAQKEKKSGHGRNGAKAFAGATTVKVPHESLKSGDDCPECPKGRVYPMAEPAVMVRIVGLSPLHATVTELERLRCNACGEIFKARQPEGLDAQKYDETTPAMIGMLKYGTGVPFHRIAVLAKHLGIPLSPSTQWDLLVKFAGRLDPVLDELVRLAAQADLIHNDDTTMKLLDRPDLDKDPKARKGVYTTSLVARVVAESHQRTIVIFRTGPRHAGENLADLLKQRRQELTAPIQMCDALAANTAGDFETIVANCLAHARRKFVEVVDDFPEECRHLLENLGKVYKADKESRAMDALERLSYHQEHSGPVMAGLEKWMEAQIKEKKVEPNSGLGKAIAYMQKHWDALTLFLREPGVPLDNNLCERTLKRAIMHRKNSLFYKTQNGAVMGDTFMTLIHTAELNGINPFDYLVAILKHPALTEENPEEWMPWNYQQTMTELENLSS